MTDSQLYFAIGVPVFAIVLNMIAGIMQHDALGARFTSIENRFTSIENRFSALEANINARFASLEARFETLTGKVIEIGNRLTRVEAILERH